MNRAGKFITVEGGEGAGKSTNIQFIQSYLMARNVELICTREPGGTHYAEQIRDILLSHQSESLDPIAELLLIFAARAQHLRRLIEPALKQGQWVLCDRFTDATYAYQGGGRGLGFERVAMLENMVQGSLRPDLTLIFDLPVAQGMSRVKARGEQDRFESERMEFFETVRQAYLDIAARDSKRYLIIDSGKPLDEVQSRIEAALVQALPAAQNLSR